MYKLIITTTNGRPVIIYFGVNGITVAPDPNYTYVYVNGSSWQTTESADSIIERIDAAIAVQR